MLTQAENEWLFFQVATEEKHMNNIRKLDLNFKHIDVLKGH